MKRYSLVIAAALFLAACGNAPKTEGSATAGEEAHTTTTATGTAPASAPIAKVSDPVCGMERGEEQWTEFVANGSDTTWFCSPHCKETFGKHPEKYKKATEEKKG